MTDQIFGSRPKVGSNSFASGSNQNAGNVLTDRPTSRVLAPAGGHSSLGYLFGGSENTRSNDAPRRGRAAEAEVTMKPGQAAPQPAPHSASQRASQPQAAAEPVFGARLKVGSNSYASGANQNAGNVLTDRPTSRVLAPPGGRSQISFG